VRRLQQLAQQELEAVPEDTRANFEGQGYPRRDVAARGAVAGAGAVSKVQDVGSPKKRSSSQAIEDAREHAEDDVITSNNIL
jgi:hypothetical protein